MSKVKLNGWEPIENAPVGGKSYEVIVVGFQSQFSWVIFTAYPNGKDTFAHGYAKPTHYYPGIISPEGLKFVP